MPSLLLLSGTVLFMYAHNIIPFMDLIVREEGGKTQKTAIITANDILRLSAERKKKP